jgi:hypothetical protein
MNRTQLLARLDEAWQDFRASYAGLPDAALQQPGVTGEWSVRDLIAHVTWWEQEALASLPKILARERLPRYSVTYGGIDAFNELRSDEWRGASLAEVLQRQAETHRLLVDLVAAVPEEQITRETRFRRRLRYDTYSHYPEHAAAIRDWRQARGPGR